MDHNTIGQGNTQYSNSNKKKNNQLRGSIFEEWLCSAL